MRCSVFILLCLINTLPKVDSSGSFSLSEAMRIGANLGMLARSWGASRYYLSSQCTKMNRTSLSPGQNCNYSWSNRAGLAFAFRNIGSPSAASMSSARSIHKNILMPFPIHASLADISQEDHITSYARDFNSQSSVSSSVITEGLNPSQQEATLRPRYSITRVIAGPGAGKTKVLTCRIAHLLLSSEGGDDEDYPTQYSPQPEGILAVTFTKKAAMEMERRLSNLLTSSTKVMFNEIQSISSSNGAAASESTSDVAYEDVAVDGNADPDVDGQTNDISRRFMRQATVGTFHSVCSKILRKFTNEIGDLPSVRECTVTEMVQPPRDAEDGQGQPMVNQMLVQTLDGSFNILDQSDQLRILKDVLKEHGIELKSDATKSVEGKSDDIRPITILNAISLLNTEDAILRTDGSGARKNAIIEETSSKMSKKVRQIASKIRVSFQKAKYAQNSVDFDDLIFLTRELLLHHPAVREVLHRRWRHILVDEFQDTSLIQLDLVRLLTTNSLFVVGDGDQSIYSWRGASPESMSDFESAFHGKMHGWEGLINHHSIDLTQYYQKIDRMRSNVDGHGRSPLQVQSVYLMENYRSTTNIVKAAQRIISSSKGDNTAAQDNIRRDMKPMRGVGPTPRVLACKTSKDEANFVVKSVNEMVERGDLTPSSTVAMIYRTNAQSRLLEEACVEHNLRYVVRGSTGTFYKRAEIQDCLSFLKIMHNDRDRSAWARAVKAPSRGIGETSLNEFFAYCDALVEKQTPMEVLLSLADPAGQSSNSIHALVSPKEFLSNRSLNRFILFASSLSALREKLKTLPVNEFLMAVIEDLNLKSHFDAISKSQDEYGDRLSNVMELVRAADRYKDDGPCISESADDEREAPLERFLDDVALIADINPADDRDDDSSGGRIVANLMTIHSSKGMEFDAVFLVGNEEGTFPTQKAIGQGEGSIELSEERRLCYVAMTRAKTHLVLTWRREVAYFSGNSFRTKDTDRSRFLNVLVNKPDGKTKNGATNTPIAKRSQVKQSSSVGTRRIHTETAVNKDFLPTRQTILQSQTGRKNNNDPWKPAKQRCITDNKILLNPKPSTGARMIHTDATRNTGVLPNQPAPPRSQTGKRNWDNWEPTQQRKSTQQVPSIRPIASQSDGSRQQSFSASQQASSVRSETRSTRPKNALTSNNRQPSRSYESHRQQPNQQVSPAHRSSKHQSVRSDPPPDIDSTLFFPIGSYVKHKFYGRGIVQPPPKSDEEFAEKLLVRVKFVEEDAHWDLPMDSLMHTYE